MVRDPADLADLPRVRTRFTTVRDGDLAPTASEPGLSERRRAVAAGPWTWLHQVHGAEVVVVGAPGEHAGSPADAAVTDVVGAVLAVQTADCAPVLFEGSVGDAPGPTVVGAAHAGWRGLAAGVLEATVESLRTLGATTVRYRLGPCISAEHYEFGEDELARLVAQFGPELRGSTNRGTASLDLRAGVRAALAAVGAIELSSGPVPCTAGDPAHYSWRARRDTGRQAAVIWLEPPATATEQLR